MTDYTRADFRTAWGWRAYQITAPIAVAIAYAIRPVAWLIVKAWEKRRG